MELARSKCLQLKDLWWRWLKSICCEEQAFVRMDFLCNIAGPGNADVRRGPLEHLQVFPHLIASILSVQGCSR